MNSKIIIFIIIFVFLNQYELWSQNIHFDKYNGVTPTKASIRIASASIITDKWQKETNWIRIEKMVTQASQEGGANVVITPEGVLDGYVINEVNNKLKSGTDKEILDRFLKLGEPIDGPFIHKASVLANNLNIYLVLGFLELEDQNLFNTAILIDPEGDIIGRYRKTHFAQGYTINPEFYKAGDKYPVIHTSFGKVGILICYDRQLPEPARILVLKGAEILFIPSYGTFNDQDGWNTIMLRTRARENNVPLVFCHPYQSLLIKSSGDLTVLGNGGDVSYYEIRVTKDENDVLRNRRPEIYNEILNVDDKSK